MATNHTTNYQLNQWEATDQVLRTEFNADNVKIDAALRANADAIAALETATAGFGNCQLWTASYVGNGMTGYNENNRITFPKLPYVVIIQAIQGECTMFLRGCTSYKTFAFPSATYQCDLRWEGNTLSWAYTGGGSNATHPQFNRDNVTYLVLAFLPADE